MSAITSLPIQAGASAHLVCNVLDQYGSVMPGLQAVIVDPGPNTSFAYDAGMTDAGTIAATSPGTDSLTATYGTFTSNLPVIVSPAPSIPTSLQWTSP